MQKNKRYKIFEFTEGQNQGRQFVIVELLPGSKIAIELLSPPYEKIIITSDTKAKVVGFIN